MSRRSSFAPVVLLGLSSAGMAAVAGHKPWLDTQAPGGSCLAVPGIDYADFGLSSPLAGALALVLLAAWGVLLVTRGWVRRVAAAVALLSAGGYVATAVAAYWQLKDAAVDAAVRAGAGSVEAGCPVLSVWMNNTWWLVALAAGVLALGTAVAAVALVGRWPEMGQRYDAPGGSADAAAPVEDQTNLEVWKAIDEGRDPTA